MENAAWTPHAAVTTAAWLRASTEMHVAGVRNLTQVEAAERARLLEVTGYDIALDLTDGSGNPGETTFRSTTEVTFRCIEPGAQTFIEVAARVCGPRR